MIHTQQKYAGITMFVIRKVCLLLACSLCLLPLVSPVALGQDIDVPDDQSEADFRTWLITSRLQEAVGTLQGTSLNSLALEQIGDGNTATLHHQGNGIAVSAKQVGDGNALSVDIDGNDVKSKLWQYGIGNSLEQSVQGTALEYSIIQSGVNLELEIEEAGPGASSYDILQTGIGMHVIIVNGLFR
jgi:hypothetical protein